MFKRSFFRLMAVLLLLASVIPSGPAGEAAPVSCIEPALRDRTLGILRKALATPSDWVKIHAAEFLLTLDYPQGVCEAFAGALKTRGDEPYYRIGLWRVMAQAARDSKEAEPWLAKICSALAASDRINATETLAKLGYAPAGAELKSVADAAASANAALAAYAQWLLANTGSVEEQRKLVQLLTSTNDTTRGIAGYAFRFKKELPGETVRLLVVTARKEPTGSSARIYLLSAAFCHATEPGDQQWLRTALYACAAEPVKDVRYEAACALARRGKAGDRALLVSLLDDPEEDVRVAAANAVLHIGRRQAQEVHD
ncbi:MAG: HEAT repeat domain-containing protein [Kiritimatiellaeota bacterium]|nr:HEAT repeat domain-containing protein [Kiritimatiellota bacterium]